MNSNQTENCYKMDGILSGMLMRPILNQVVLFAVLQNVTFPFHLPIFLQLSRADKWVRKCAGGGGGGGGAGPAECMRVDLSVANLGNVQNIASTILQWF